MSPLISIRSLSKSYGPKVLFSDLNLTLLPGQRAVLIGENGCGKSTLLRLILGLEEPDSGSIERFDGSSFGYLSQNIDIKTLEMTLEEALYNAQTDYELLQRFGLLKLPRERRLSELSGGELQIARLMALGPKSLMLLDEPTNHLDEDSKELFVRYLRQLRCTILLVTHDRDLIDILSTDLFELSAHEGLRYYRGNYSSYLQERTEERERKRAEQQRIELERATLRQEIKRSTHSQKKPTKPRDQNVMAYDKHGERFDSAKSRKLKKAKQRLDELDARRPVLRNVSEPHLRFTPQPLQGEVVARLREFEIRAGERVALIGPNGSGKTTFLDRFIKEAQFHHSAQVWYLRQYSEIVDHDRTLVEYLKQRSDLSESELIAKLVQIGLVERRFFQERIESLSQGQMRKVELLEMMLSSANLLVLDEPTNHLAPSLIDVLEEALSLFEGALLIVSHDERFVQKVATKRVLVNNS